MTRRQLDRDVEARLRKLQPILTLADPDHPARIRMKAYRIVRKVIAANGGRRGADQSWAETMALAVGADLLHEEARSGAFERRELFRRLAQLAERVEQTRPDPRAVS